MSNKYKILLLFILVKKKRMYKGKYNRLGTKNFFFFLRFNTFI